MRGVRRALVDDLREAVGERTVDLVGVRGDPRQVGGAPVHVVGLRVEVRPVGPAACVRYPPDVCTRPFGLPGGARRVDDEQRVSASNACASCTSGAVSTASCHQTSRPSVHGCRTSRPGAADDEHVLDVVSPRHGLVGGRLHRRRPAAAELPVAGDEQLGARVLHAEPQRLGGEPAEHQRVHRRRCARSPASR